MPLPDAEPGKKSISQTAFDQVKDPVFINAEWEDEARRLKLWGEIAGKASSSGPLVGTMKIVSVTVTDNTMTEWFRPAQGEIWVMVNISDSVTNITGSVVRNGQYYDGTTQSGFYYNNSSSTGLIWSEDTNFPDYPFYVTNEVYVRAQWNGTFDSINGYMTVIRVR